MNGDTQPMHYQHREDVVQAVQDQIRREDRAFFRRALIAIALVLAVLIGYAIGVRP